MADAKTIMSWLEGLAEPDWRTYHSDSEVQNIAKETLDILHSIEWKRPPVYVQTEIPGLPEKPKMPKQYRSFAEAINDPDYPKEKKLSVIEYMCRLETHNGVTKDDLVSMLRWVVNENYDWVLPDPKPAFRVVK